MADKQINDCRPGQPRVVGDVEIQPIERIVVRVETVFGGNCRRGLQRTDCGRDPDPGRDVAGGSRRLIHRAT